MSFSDNFRVTTVEYTVGEVNVADHLGYPTEHTVIVPHDLSPNYFVVVNSANQDGFEMRTDRGGIALTHDPFGTGDLLESGDSRLLIFSSGTVVSRKPEFHVTIIECLVSNSPNGFMLRDVIKIEHPTTTVSGTHTTNNTVENIVNVDQCTVHGINQGAGVMGTSLSAYSNNMLFAREVLTSSTNLQVDRYNPASIAGFEDSTSYHMIVEWGYNFTVQSDSHSGTANSSSGNSGLLPSWDTRTVSTYDPTKTIMFPNYVAKFDSDDYEEIMFCFMPAGQQAYSVGTTIASSDETEYAYSVFRGNINFDMNMQLVTHEELSVTHFAANIFSTVGDRTSPGTSTVPTPVRSGTSEVNDIGPLGADRWVGQRALLHSITTNSGGAGVNNQTEFIGLHFNSDEEVEWFTNGSVAQIDLFISSVDFGNVGYVELTDSNSATTGQYFIFPYNTETTPTKVTSATSEGGIALQSTSDASFANPTYGTLKPVMHSQTMSESFDADVKFTRAGRKGISEYVWKKDGESEYTGTDHILFPWGHNERMSSLSDVQLIDTTYNHKEGCIYYAAAGASERISGEIKVYKRLSSDAIYSTEVLVDTVDITDFGLTLTAGQMAGSNGALVTKFAITDLNDGGVMLVIAHPNELTGQAAFISLIKEYGESSFTMNNTSLMHGMGYTGGAYLEGLRAARSGQFVKFVVATQDSSNDNISIGNADNSSSIESVWSGTTADNGSSWVVREETAWLRAIREEDGVHFSGTRGENPIVLQANKAVSSNAQGWRSWETTLHDLCGASDGTGNFYYSVALGKYAGGSMTNINGGEVVICTSQADSELAYVSSSRYINDSGFPNTSFISLACTYDAGYIYTALEQYTFNVTSQSYGSTVGFLRHLERDLSQIDAYTSTSDGGITGTSGPIYHGVPDGNFRANLRIEQAFGGIELLATTASLSTGSFPTSSLGVHSIQLGGWSTMPITTGNAVESGTNPLSILYYEPSAGEPDEDNGALVGASNLNLWQKTTSFTAPTINILNGYITMGMKSNQYARYHFVSSDTTDAGLFFHEGWSGGFTNVITTGRAIYTVEAAGVGSTGFKMDVKLQDGEAEVLVYSGTSTTIQKVFVEGLVSGESYQFVLGYDGDGGGRLSYRNLSATDHRSSWVTSSFSVNTFDRASAGETEDKVTFGSAVDPLFVIGSGSARFREVWTAVSNQHVSGATTPSQLNTVSAEDFGRNTTSYPTYLDSGYSVSFSGYSSHVGDEYNVSTRPTYPKENILEKNPRTKWVSVDESEQKIVMEVGAFGSRKVVHEAVSLFGTNFRHAYIDYDDSIAFTSGMRTEEIFSDLTGTLTVSSTDDNILNFPAGHGMFKGEHRGRWIMVLTGTDAGKVYLIEEHPMSDTLQITTGTHSIVANDTLVVFGDRFAKLYSDAIDGKIFRIRIPAQETFSGSFEVGTLVAGPVFNPGCVPLDWTITEQDDPGLKTFESSNGFSWSYQERPERRTVSGRFIGDVNSQRESFRAMVRNMCSYSVLPLTFVPDGNSPSNTAILGCIEDGLTMDSEGWYKDDTNRWRMAGDMGITITEVT